MHATLSKADLQETEESPTLRQLARAALDKFNGKIDPAVSYLRSQIINDPVLLESVLLEAIEVAVEDCVRAEHRHDRETIVKVAWDRSILVDSSKRMAARVLADVRYTLLNFPLDGGLKLKDATKDQIQRTADRYQGTATDADFKFRFLAAVAKPMKVGQKAIDVYDDDKLQAVWNKVKKETE